MLAYFDCFSGISGDMTLGALIDLGVPVVWLKEQLMTLAIGDIDLVKTPVQHSGIGAVSVKVVAGDDKTSRNFSTIRTLISNSSLSEVVKMTSLKIFGRLAEAEAGVHNCSVEEVHFHEVGGIDAIADIVGTEVLFHGCDNSPCLRTCQQTSKQGVKN